jgi:hypothetical protein
MSRSQEMQRVIRAYKDATGIKSVDMKLVSAWAVETLGWPVPKPVDPMDRLAKQFSAAAREETRTDTETGESYRVHHMYVVEEGEAQYHLWIDIDEAPREPMQASLTMRREQIVGDITQLTFDAEHWNRINPEEEPIQIEADFGLDVEIRRHTPIEH